MSMNVFDLPIDYCDRGPMPAPPQPDHYRQAAELFWGAADQARLEGCKEDQEFFEAEAARCEKVLRMLQWVPLRRLIRSDASGF